MIAFDHYVACSSCSSDLGSVWGANDGVIEEDYVPVNFEQGTAHVSDTECPGCGTIVFRAQRALKVTVRR